MSPGCRYEEQHPAEINFFPSHDTQQHAIRQRSAIRSFSWPRCIEDGAVFSAKRHGGPELVATCSPREEDSTPGSTSSPTFPHGGGGLPTWGILGRPHHAPTASTTAKPRWSVPVVCPRELRGIVSQYAPQIMQQSFHVTIVRLSRGRC